MTHERHTPRARRLRRALRDHGLSLILLVLFVTCWGGQLCAGWMVANDERRRDHEPAQSFTEYVRSAHALEATAENWESEFLQMCAFAVLTAFFFQRGSAESRDPVVRASPVPSRVPARAPWPIKRGGWVLKVYEHSLSLVLGLLFVASLLLHLQGGAGVYNDERLRRGEPALSPWEFAGTSQFWFESFQNWQSEFLSIGAMVILTIFLREKGSPESKRVESPHDAHE